MAGARTSSDASAPHSHLSDNNQQHFKYDMYTKGHQVPVHSKVQDWINFENNFNLDLHDMDSSDKFCLIRRAMAILEGRAKIVSKSVEDLHDPRLS
jgi:hypothetical protein